MPENDLVTFTQFVGSWRDGHLYINAHSDLSEYYMARYRAYSTAFGVNLEQCPAGPLDPPAWMDLKRMGKWQPTIHKFVLANEKRYRNVDTPFSGFLEAPREIHAVYERHGTRFNELCDATEQAASDMIVELLAVLFPEAAARRVTPNDIREAGFDPTEPAPDPMDYW